MYSIFQERLRHFANREPAPGRLRGFVKCVLFAFTVPPGGSLRGVIPVCVCVFALPGLLAGKDFVHLGIFIRNLMLLSGGASGLWLLLLIVMSNL